MPGTLLIGNPETTWREWLKTHAKGRDVVCLDPADASHSFPARLYLYRSGKQVYSRFYGSLDPMRSPHVLLAALAQSLQTSADPIVQLFPYRATPLMRQVVGLVAQLMQPSQVLVAEGTHIDQGGFPVGPEAIALDKAFLPMVQDAQRKAQWLKLVEEAEEHEVDLSKVTIEGARLGSGIRVAFEEHARVALNGAMHVETTGAGLLIVAEEEPDEDVIIRAQDVLGCNRTTLVAPRSYEGLLCSFARQTGEDFGMGLVQEIDWGNRRARVLCTAVPPAPVRILRLGSLRIDTSGRELGEARPWQV